MTLSPVTLLLNETGKTVQPTTTRFGLRKCLRRTTYAANDRISMLPDDLLLPILSRLKLEEAARTSVLSNRWRYLWTSTPTLVFSDFLRLRVVLREPTEEQLSILRLRFIDFVNKVVKSHRAPSLDEFRISFDVDDKECYKFDIENWIKFALERGVKRLELSLSCCYGFFTRGHYALTTQFLQNCRLDSIKSLHLHTVDVTEEVVDYILSHCLCLEFLYMGTSKSLVNLKVSGPSLRLKHLEIHAFRILKTIEISDIDLEFFKYTGNANVHIKDVPHLAELSLSGECAFFLLRNRLLFSTLLSKLETLVLDLNCQKDESFLKFPELMNLRKLDFKLEAYSPSNVVRGASLLMVLLEVSPLLHTLVLEFEFLQEHDTSYWRQLFELNKVQKANGPHQCLKVFKLFGFVGCEADIEITKYILNVAVSLEKIIIDTSSSLGYYTGKPEEMSAARTRARQLETLLPLGAKLVIL